MTKKEAQKLNKQFVDYLNEVEEKDINRRDKNLLIISFMKSLLQDLSKREALLVAVESPSLEILFIFLKFSTRVVRGVRFYSEINPQKTFIIGGHSLTVDELYYLFEILY